MVEALIHGSGGLAARWTVQSMLGDETVTKPVPGGTPTRTTSVGMAAGMTWGEYVATDGAEGEGLGDCNALGVRVTDAVQVLVDVAESVRDCVGLQVRVGVRVAVPDCVGTAWEHVTSAVEVLVDVAVSVRDRVGLRVRVGVPVAVAVADCVTVGDGEA